MTEGCVFCDHDNGIQDQAIPATGLTQPHLETYEVTHARVSRAATAE